MDAFGQNCFDIGGFVGEEVFAFGRGHGDLFGGDHFTIHPEGERHRFTGIRTTAGESRLDRVFAIEENPVGRFDRIRAHPLGRAAGAGERYDFFVVVVIRVRVQDGLRGQFDQPKSASRNSLGSCEVALGQKWRHAQDIADVIEAIAGVIDRKFFGGLVVDAEKIADGVLVLHTIQMFGGDAARVDGRAAVRFVDGPP